ncbi:MAG TPA: hypothetical protein VJ869_01450, partial [Sphaerochaeta sp.]|nr:hypothetical protein [Sphaerochaeta sp.]
IDQDGIAKSIDIEVLMTKDNVGLGDVDNTSDADKPVSTAQQGALDNKADKDTDAIVGNFASFDASGNTIDSGKKDADYEDADDTILKKAQVKNNLTSTNTDLPLSANQGKVLKEGQDELAGAGWAGETVKGNAEDIGTLNGDDSTEGSVAYDIKQSSDALKGVDYTEGSLKTHEDRLDTLEADDTTAGSVLKSIKDNAENATFTPAVGSGISAVTLENAVNEVGSRVTSLEAYNPINSWQNIQEILRQGRIKQYLSVGDQFMATYENVAKVWDVIGIDEDTPANSAFTHSLTIQSRTLLGAGQISAPQAIVGAVAEIPAGTHVFTLNGIKYQVTTTQPVPIGGVMYG